MTRLFFLSATLAAAALSGTAVAAKQPEKSVVTVFAAASLREAFEAAAPEFSKAAGYPVRFDFGGSDTLATQLSQGAPGDVFASANVVQMEKVTTLVETPRTLAHNRLVVIAPKDDAAVSSLSDLAKPGVKTVLAARSVPAGAYARAAFGALEKEPGYGTGFAARANANVISEETDVKAVAAKIALGEGDAGVVYATDVTAALVPKLRVLHFPNGTAPQATYVIAAVRGSQNADGARAWVAFITSAAGKKYLKARGFEE